MWPGHSAVVFYARLDRPIKHDFVAPLSDVYPDGRAIQLQTSGKCAGVTGTPKEIRRRWRPT